MKRREFIISSAIAVGGTALLTGCGKKEIIKRDGEVAKRKFRDLEIPLLGFGCMRLPMQGDEVDTKEVDRMVDYCMEHGVNYFDTAYMYVDERSELVMGKSLKRYKREDFILTDKLTKDYFKNEEEIRPFFESQLELTGVKYFDYYLMHALDKGNYDHFQKYNAFKVASELKKEGKIKHLGISFHDNEETLERILTDHPEIEIVQIQFNYIDYDSPSVRSKKVYDVCRKFNKPILIMEPVKGGALVRLPDKAKEIFDKLNHGSYASYAIRYAASFDGVYKVLSGMSDFEQMKDNVSYMKEFTPLNEEEYKAIDKVKEILKSLGGIPCTACRYCVEGCPMGIPIPDLFACYNARKQFKDWNSSMYYNIYTSENGKASSCVRCGQCEEVCPQHLHIRELLEKVSKEFE